MASPTEQTEAGRLRERLDLLSSLSQALGTPRELDELFRAIYRETNRILDTSGFILGLYDDVSQTVHVVHQIESGVEFPGGSFPLGSGFTSQVIRTRQPRLIRNWSTTGPRVQVQYGTERQALPESGITVPLLLGDRVIGVLSVQSWKSEAYDEDDLLTLQAIAGQAAIAIVNLRQAARLDAQLHRRVSELEAILSGMTEALLIVDAEGRIVRLNTAARTLLFPPGSIGTIILGQPLTREQWDHWPLGAREIAQALTPIFEALQRGESLHDVEVQLRGEGRRVLSFNCNPLRDTGGALTGGIIVFRDVTERREVERLKDEVLSIASHDLKAPVTIIKGQAQILARQVARGQATSESLNAGLAAIARQSDRLVDLLGVLLDLSRLEAGRLDLKRQRTNLVAVVNEVVQDVQPMTDRHRLEVKGPPSVEGTWDKQRLEQVVQNLLTNAVKYSPDGGTIEVTVEADEHSATVSVHDEGVGIPPDELPHIFERFYRVEGTHRLEGSGLGLYICEGIVTAHGGRIWAESPGLGQGATFRFTIPRLLEPKQ